MSRQILINNVSADVISGEFISGGGSVIINARGDDFNGGIITLEIASEQDSGNRFTALQDGVFGGNQSVTINHFPQGSKLRAVLSGTSSGATNVFCDIVQ